MSQKKFYQNGKIYKIVDNTNGNVYIGSTCKLLCQRLSNHRSNYKQYKKDKCSYSTSFEIIENNDCVIVLIENYPCQTVKQLLARERYYIESLNCINKNIPARTRKEYRESNKNKIELQNKLYKETNNEVIKIQNKEYHEKNKVKRNQNAKQYRVKNNSKFKVKMTCDCGANFRIADKNRHEKSNKHQKYVTQLAQYNKILEMQKDIQIIVNNYKKYKN